MLVNDLSGAYQTRCLRSVEKAARNHGLNLVILCGRELGNRNAHDEAQNVLYSGWLGAGAVDGVILLAGSMANHSGTRALTELCRQLYPLPVCGIGSPIPEIPSIGIDNRAAMRTAVDHLIQRHRRKRIAYIGGPAGNEEAAARFAGYEDALRHADLPFDAGLVATGDFTAPTGRDAMREILARRPDLDALAAANDDMALGACDLLRENELSVSENVLVVGFDDSAVGRYAARSLSSVAQPLDQMANAAVARLLELMNGKPASGVNDFGAQLVLRESCGCGYVIRDVVPPRAPQDDDGETASAYLVRNEQILIERLQPEVGTSPELWARWGHLLVRALHDELSDRPGSFPRVVDEIAEDAAREGESIEDVTRAVARLRAEFQASGKAAQAGLKLERIWMKALAILTAATTRDEGRAALALQIRAVELGHASHRLWAALAPEALAATLEASLPALGIGTLLLAVRSGGDERRLSPLLAVRNRRRIKLANIGYDPRGLLPPDFDDERAHSSLVLMALTFETDVLGLIAFDSRAEPFVCEMLRWQISATLKLGALRRRLVALGA